MGYLDLNQLADAVKHSRQDLQEVRRIADQAWAEIGKLDRRQFSEGYIREMSDRIKVAAAAKAQAVLDKNSTATRAHQVRASASHWTVPKFLARARMTRNQAAREIDLMVKAPEITNADLFEVLTAIEWVARTGKMAPASLSDALDEALAQRAWGVVNSIYEEVATRRDRQDANPDLLLLHSRLQTLRVDEVTRGKELISEHNQISEMIGYAQKSVFEGIDKDTGRAMERAIELRTAREQTAAAEQQQRGH